MFENYLFIINNKLAIYVITPPSIAAPINRDYSCTFMFFTQCKSKNYIAYSTVYSKPATPLIVSIIAMAAVKTGSRQCSDHSMFQYGY